MTWPDIVIAGFMLIAALKGFKRGFVLELSGIIALAIGVTAAFWYRGSIDGALAGIVHVGPGSAHVIGMAVTGVAAYAAALVASMFLRPLAGIPGVNLVNAALGAAVGVLKAAAFVWAIVYAALFFPLSTDLRQDLHRSGLVAIITAPNDRIDDALKATLPWFVKPFVQPLFGHHRV